jgi:hypothetical protein
MAVKAVKEPKITVNKLGEFLVASPKRQRAILEQLKYPKDNVFSSSPYNDVRNIIKQYFVSNFDESIVEAAIEDFEKKISGKTKLEWSDTIVASSIDALEKVLDFSFDCSDFTFSEYQGKNPKVIIKEVEISMNPDLIVSSSLRNKDCVGALKIHISKGSKSDIESCKYVATLMNDFTIAHLCNSSITNRHENSISYDVFKDIFVESPKSFKKRMADIEAGCMNIKAIWDSI